LEFQNFGVLEAPPTYSETRPLFTLFAHVMAGHGVFLERWVVVKSLRGEVTLCLVVVVAWDVVSSKHKAQQQQRAVPFLESQKARRAAMTHAMTIAATTPRQTVSTTKHKIQGALTTGDATNVRHGIDAREEARSVVAKAHTAEIDETGDVDQYARAVVVVASGGEVALRGGCARLVHGNAASLEVRRE
jgi:hypothetical protein